MITVFEAGRQIHLRTKNSFYAMGWEESGRFLHLGSGVVPACEPGAEIGVDAPFDLSECKPDWFPWEEQAARDELTVCGDVNYHEVALAAILPGALLRRGDGFREVADLRLRYDSHQISSEERPGFSPAHGRGQADEGERPTLCVVLKDEACEVFVRLFYRPDFDLDVIERWIEVENGTPEVLTIETLAFGTVHFANGDWTVVVPTGGWGREFEIFPQNLLAGNLVFRQLGLNTGHAQNPVYLLHRPGAASEESGTVHFGMLSYSGNWEFRFERISTGGVRLHAGYDSSVFSLQLSRGERHRTPSIITGISGDGIGGASRRMHAFLRRHVLIASASKEDHSVLYNSWEATGFSISHDQQLELARIAASIGVELFVVDDGWFGGRRSDRAGLGDWVVSREVFPGGLHALIEEVRKLGMKFGIWFEPEMVNPDSDLYRRHPDWVLHFPGRPRTEARNQLILDFGRPEVVEEIYGQMEKFLIEHPVDFIKWDMNRYASEPGSVAGRAFAVAHVRGVYEIMDRLRKKFPQLVLQSCSGGGGRVDAGVLGRADQVWTSDNTDAADRLSIQEGFSLAYPACAMECWVTEEHNPITGRHSSLEFRFDVAMRGVLGIGTNLKTLGPEELEICRRKIAFYKKIRPVVQRGELFRVLREKSCSAWQFLESGGERAVYSFASSDSRPGHHPPPSVLRGLIPSARYRLSDADGALPRQYSGWQLMTLGMPGDIRNGGLGHSIRSRTIFLEREG